jgi:N-methylhydantoinase A
MVSLERGHDPRRFALLAFGGAGPLHAAAVARSLGIPRVVIPRFPGVFSAVGLLLADLRVDVVWTQAFRSTDVDADVVERQFERIAQRATEELREEGFDAEPTIARAINMRYLGQNYEHEVEISAEALTGDGLREAFERFARLHDERYGYAIEGETVELVSFKVTATGHRPAVRLVEPQPGDVRASGRREVYFRGHGPLDATVVHRAALPVGQTLAGPALIQEDGSTTLVPPGMLASKSAHGSLILSVDAEEPR